MHTHSHTHAHHGEPLLGVSIRRCEEELTVSLGLWWHGSGSTEGGRSFALGRMLTGYLSHCYSELGDENVHKVTMGKREIIYFV